MELIWNTCNKGSWCGFFSVNLNHHHFDDLKGVYIIWQGDGQIIRVGQGIIRDRLSIHREDKEIAFYGNLFVTWVEISSQFSRDGVERYLFDNLRPIKGDRSPDVEPIIVNLPWPY